MARPLSRARINTCVLINLCATPGLGSLFARRPVAGTGQLVLALAGCLLVLEWFFKVMGRYYGQMLDGAPLSQSTPTTNLVLGGVLFGAGWCWSLVTSISLLREASRAKAESLKFFAAGLMKLDEQKISRALGGLPRWQRTEQTISRTFVFAHFRAAMKFVNAVADLAEQAEHHPDIDVRWNQVTLALTTHDAGGLTEKDFALAREFDELGAAAKAK